MSGGRLLQLRILRLSSWGRGGAGACGFGVAGLRSCRGAAEGADGQRVEGQKAERQQEEVLRAEGPGAKGPGPDGRRAEGLRDSVVSKLTEAQRSADSTAHICEALAGAKPYPLLPLFPRRQPRKPLSPSAPQPARQPSASGKAESQPAQDLRPEEPSPEGVEARQPGPGVLRAEQAGAERVPNERSFFRRPLAAPLVAFSSEEGRLLLKECLLHLRSSETRDVRPSFFALMAAFDMQRHPVSCGPATLAMALSALKVAPWRHSLEALSPRSPVEAAVANRETSGFSQAREAGGAGSTAVEGLSVGAGRDGVRGGEGAGFKQVDEEEVVKYLLCPSIRAAAFQDGVSLDIMWEMARNVKGLRVHVGYGEGKDEGLRAFRDALQSATLWPLHHPGEVMVLNFSRASLAQTGSGHFSTVAAWNSEKDMVLVLDTARFKYSSFWVPVSMLWKAFESVDPDTQKPRGYLLLSRAHFAP